MAVLAWAGESRTYKHVAEAKDGVGLLFWVEALPFGSLKS